MPVKTLARKASSVPGPTCCMLGAVALTGAPLAGGVPAAVVDGGSSAGITAQRRGEKLRL